MRFFNSRLHETFPTPTALYVVQETRKDLDSPKTWSVPRFDSEKADTLGGIFPGLGSKRFATVIAKTLARAETLGQLRRREGGSHEFKPCPRCLGKREHPAWATYELRHPLLLAHEVAQWLDICSDCLIESTMIQTLKQVDR